MNLDSASSASSGPPPNQRRDRGAIAIQACDTCRSRKQRCDEQRPKCGLCQRMKLECRYREPQPTKKDKTLVEILDRLKSLESKVDRIPTRAPVPPGFGPSQPSPSSAPSFGAEIEADPSPSSHLTPSLHPSTQPSPSGTGKSNPYRHTSAAHKMLAWPAMQQLLLQSLPSNIGDLKSFEQEGTAFIVQVQNGMPNLPLEVALRATPFVGMQTQATRATGGERTIFPSLTREKMIYLATAYFDTFNFIYPFMDRQNFLSDTLTRVYTEGFNGDTDSVMALLIFALGELAIESAQGRPIDNHEGRPSGIKGGTTSKPPGLEYFNAARERMGFVLTECDLENVQVFSLAALYYESCSRHVDFWRMTVSASSACKVLVTCYPIDWNSPRGDLVKRVFWHCALMETCLHLELDLPLTGIVDLEDRVGIPSFNSPFCEADHRGNQISHFEAHYASQVALRRLCANLNESINESMTNSNNADPSTLGGLTANTLKQLASQLNQWRSMLPQELQWNEDDPTGFSNPPSPVYKQPVDPSLTQQQRTSGTPMFSADLDSEPASYPYAYDIQVALLRTRYYYAKYMVHRPFVYKALHFPEQMTQQDAEGAAECLRSCLNWPLAFSPTSRRKRLVPYLFCWSQNFLGILLILHLTRINPMLRDIRAQLCGPKFESEVSQSVDLMLDWIRDLKSIDPIARWCWKILQGIYHLDP